MNTRFRLGISAFALSVAGLFAAPAQGAVTVIGGGIARSCYEAVEYSKVTEERAVEICNTALEQESMTKRNRAATLTNRGILFMRMGNNDKALADYSRSIRLMPELLEVEGQPGRRALRAETLSEDAMQALNEGVDTELSRRARHRLLQPGADPREAGRSAVCLRGLPPGAGHSAQFQAGRRPDGPLHGGSRRRAESPAVSRCHLPRLRPILGTRAACGWFFRGFAMTDRSLIEEAGPGIQQGRGHSRRGAGRR